jgi:hypothetical protein
MCNYYEHHPCNITNCRFCLEKSVDFGMHPQRLYQSCNMRNCRLYLENSDSADYDTYPHRVNNPCNMRNCLLRLERSAGEYGKNLHVSTPPLQHEELSSLLRGIVVFAWRALQIAVPILTGAHHPCTMKNLRMLRKLCKLQYAFSHEYTTTARCRIVFFAYGNADCGMHPYVSTPPLQHVRILNMCDYYEHHPCNITNCRFYLEHSVDFVKHPQRLNQSCNMRNCHLNLENRYSADCNTYPHCV